MKGWDGMGWDGMGWDGMGWDGMGWDHLHAGQLGIGEEAADVRLVLGPVEDLQLPAMPQEVGGVAHNVLERRVPTGLDQKGDGVGAPRLLRGGYAWRLHMAVAQGG